jgi:hypothetical protein
MGQRSVNTIEIGTPEDTLVEDQLPNLVDSVLSQFAGTLPEGLTAAWLARALEVSLVALLRDADETFLAATLASRPRGFTRCELVPTLNALVAELDRHQVAEGPLRSALDRLVAVGLRYTTHDASPREITTAALFVARLAGRLEAEHRAMSASARRFRECSQVIDGLEDLLRCDGPGDPKTLDTLHALCEEGVPSALGTLGLLYSTGQAVPLDGIRGAWLLAEAAALGDSAACTNLAMHYALGTPDFPANFRKATLFTQLSRDRGR